MSEPTQFRALIDSLIGKVPFGPPKGDTLPHWPKKDDEDQRVRMGCPVKGADLLHRYNEVIGGTSPSGWTDDEFLDGFRFEWALADLVACRGCPLGDTDGQKRVLKLPGGQERVLGYIWPDCRSVHGGGYYMDLHRKRTRDSGKPVFVMTNCASVLQRKAEIARRQVDYR